MARSHDEILQMRVDWQHQRSRFAAFRDRIRGRISPHPLPNLKLTPRGNPSTK